MNLPITPSCPSRDFDFLVGTWHARQRRLRERLRGSQDWEIFDGLQEVQNLPGGVINFDTLVAQEWRPGWVGMSLRIYNPVTRLWSIYWVTNDGASIDPRSGHLGAPVVGRFEGDEGVFAGADVFEGRPIQVRYRWQRQGPDAARWEQACSDDAGQTWEVNWIMEFTRAPAGVPLA